MKEEICFIKYKNIKFIQASIIHRCISNAAFQFSKDRWIISLLLSSRNARIFRRKHYRCPKILTSGFNKFDWQIVTSDSVFWILHGGSSNTSIHDKRTCEQIVGESFTKSSTRKKIGIIKQIASVCILKSISCITGTKPQVTGLMG